jgi:hypothetical protein
MLPRSVTEEHLLSITSPLRHSMDTALITPEHEPSKLEHYLGGSSPGYVLVTTSTPSVLLHLSISLIFCTFHDCSSLGNIFQLLDN